VRDRSPTDDQCQTTLTRPEDPSAQATGIHSCSSLRRVLPQKPRAFAAGHPESGRDPSQDGRREADSSPSPRRKPESSLLPHHSSPRRKPGSRLLPHHLRVVTPAKAGVQTSPPPTLGPGFRRDDDRGTSYWRRSKAGGGRREAGGGRRQEGASQHGRCQAQLPAVTRTPSPRRKPGSRAGGWRRKPITSHRTSPTHPGSRRDDDRIATRCSHTS
jgi:hypothetical protein